MSNDAPDQRSRARLEAIVFGRPGAVTDEEMDAAASELARRFEAERPPPVEPEPIAAAPPSDPSEALRTPPSRRRVAITALAVILGAAAVVAGVQVRALTTTDSMVIFDRPQTDADLVIQSRLTDPSIRYESVRYAGSADGYEVYVYRTIANELSPARMSLVCMVVTQGEQTTGGSCANPADFAFSGATMRFEADGGWADVSWSIRSGVTLATGEYPPIPPALSAFDEPQDDEDRAALAFVPEIRADLQESARYLGKNGGYSLIAYRGEQEDVCLAVYVPSAIELNSASACVDRADFESTGIQLAYPSADPTVSVRWGPDPSFSISGR